VKKIAVLALLVFARSTVAAAFGGGEGGGEGSATPTMEGSKRNTSFTSAGDIQWKSVSLPKERK